MPRIFASVLSKRLSRWLHSLHQWADNDATQEEEIRNKLQAKDGNAFKNLLVNGKGKDTKAPELTPIGQVEAKDSFKEVKNQTMNDVLALHRVPIELMSIRRESITSLDLNKVDWLFHKNELLPLIDMMQELNEFVGNEVITENKYVSLEVSG